MKVLRAACIGCIWFSGWMTDRISYRRNYRKFFFRPFPLKGTEAKWGILSRVPAVVHRSVLWMLLYRNDKSLDLHRLSFFIRLIWDNRWLNKMATSFWEEVRQYICATAQITEAFLCFLLHHALMCIKKWQGGKKLYSRKKWRHNRPAFQREAGKYWWWWWWDQQLGFSVLTEKKRCSCHKISCQKWSFDVLKMRHKCQTLATVTQKVSDGKSEKTESRRKDVASANRKRPLYPVWSVCVCQNKMKRESL